MSENKFRVGDRVRVKDPEWELRFDCGNDIGVVTSMEIGVVNWESFYGEDFVEVAFCDGWIRDDLPKEELEVVEPYDPKTAFLSELKGVLEKYGAEIELLSYDLDTTQLGITSNEFEVEYPIDIQRITAKNILDYDKK